MTVSTSHSSPVYPPGASDTLGWLQFLHGQGIDNAGAGANPMPAPADHFVAPLTHLGLIAASGEEAAGFLHAQLTNDIEHLPADLARLAAYCSPKGRMLASMLVWRNDDAIMLQLPAEILAPILKRLQMYVLRSKAKLADASQSQVAIGVVGTQAAAQLAALTGLALPTEVYRTSRNSAQVIIRVPDAGSAVRYQWLTDPSTAMQAWPELTRAAPAGAASDWRLSEIRAGLPTIVQATQEKFVPQMINFEVIGGVNFRKGCYPGQEIVARSQYLGKLKRRMLPAEVDAIDVAPGTDVYASTDPGQPGGQIVNAEMVATGRSCCLVELKTTVLDQNASLHLGSPDGPMLRLSSLPYPLTEPA